MNHPLSPPVFPCAWACEWGEDVYGLWQALSVNGVHHRFRWVEPGKFMMGSHKGKKGEKGRYDDEDRHAVTISTGFWLGETTVAQALWEAVMGDNPSRFKGAELPVESVSWDDANTFVGRLNNLHPHLKCRLPREAEWEYACRSGADTPFHFGETIDLQQANYRSTWEFDVDKWGADALQKTAQVKSYPCNDWGLYEMHGNVWEWCSNVWRDHLGVADVTDPWRQQETDESATGENRVVRGGSWFSNGRNCRSAIRRWYVSGYRGHDVGLRLAQGH